MTYLGKEIRLGDSFIDSAGNIYDSHTYYEGGLHITNRSTGNIRPVSIENIDRLTREGRIKRIPPVWQPLAKYKVVNGWVIKNGSKLCPIEKALNP